MTISIPLQNYITTYPKVFHRYLITFLALGLFIASIIVINLYSHNPTVLSGSTTTHNVLVDLANGERIKQNLKPLKINPKLEAAAAAKAKDMFAKDYFDHIAFNKTPWQFINATGYDYEYAGENLAIDFTSLSDTHTAWMQSSIHRSNVLDKNFTEIGIATVKGQYKDRTTTITVVMFGTPTSNISDLINR